MEQREVKLPTYDRVPRWLIIQGEMDLRLFILEEMLEDHKKKLPIERMIDEATGYDKELTAQVQELIAECRWLKAEYDKETQFQPPTPNVK